jgi:hypothetical protein
MPAECESHTTAQRGALHSFRFCERERVAFHSANAFLALLPRLSFGKWAFALPASLRYQCLRVLIEAPRHLILDSRLAYLSRLQILLLHSALPWFQPSAGSHISNRGPLMRLA